MAVVTGFARLPVDRLTKRVGSGAERQRREHPATSLNGVRLRDGLRFEFQEGARIESREAMSYRLQSSPQAAFPLDANGQRFERPKQCGVAPASMGDMLKGQTGNLAGHPFRSRREAQLDKDSAKDVSLQ